MYAISNPEHSAYSMTGDACWDEYHKRKQIYTNKNYWCYGYQLIETKPKKIGFNIKFEFDFLHTRLKPYFSIKWDKQVAWLWFSIRFDFKTYEAFHRIVKDWKTEDANVAK